MRISKAQAKSKTLIDKKEDENVEKKPEGKGKPSDPAKPKGFPQGVGPDKQKGQQRPEEDEEDPESDGDESGDEEAGDPNTAMEQSDHENGGHKVSFHKDVHAHMAEDADFQHHASEHSKHVAGYESYKGSDPDRAEAHRQAANLHARVGNALHAAGETERTKSPPPPMGLPGEGLPGEMGGSGEDDPAMAGMDDEIDSELEGMEGAAAGGAVDVQGRPIPTKPDATRNPPSVVQPKLMIKKSETRNKLSYSILD